MAGTCFYQETDASRTVAIELNDLAEDERRVRSRYNDKRRFILLIHKSPEPITRHDFDVMVSSYRRNMCSFDLEPFAASIKNGRRTYHLTMNHCGFGTDCSKRNPVEYYPKRAFRKPYSFFLLNGDHEILFSGWAD